MQQPLDSQDTYVTPGYSVRQLMSRFMLWGSVVGIAACVAIGVLGYLVLAEHFRQVERGQHEMVAMTALQSDHPHLFRNISIDLYSNGVVILVGSVPSDAARVELETVIVRTLGREDIEFRMQSVYVQKY